MRQLGQIWRVQEEPAIYAFVVRAGMLLLPLKLPGGIRHARGSGVTQEGPNALPERCPLLLIVTAYE